MAATRAGELPSHIIVALITRLLPDLYHSPKKKGVATFSLVCRHWAHSLRETLFSSLTLRTRNDFVFLLAILDCPIARPGPPLHECIAQLTIAQFPDWSLGPVNVFRKISKRIKLSCIELDVRNCQVSAPLPTPDGRRTQDYLPFFSLPRPLPGRLLLPLTDLRLSNVQLPRQTDLVRLLDSLPTVRNCFLTEVRFVESAAIRRRLLRPHSRLTHVQLCDCGDGTLGSQLELAAALIASQRRVRIDDEKALGAALPVMLAWLPAASQYEKVAVHVNIAASKTSPFWGMNVYDGKVNCLAGVIAHFQSNHRLVDATDFAAHSIIRRIDLWDDGTCHDEPTRLRLMRFEERLLQLPSIPVRTSIVGHRNAIEQVLCAVFEGVLNEAVKRHLFQWCPKHRSIRVHPVGGNTSILSAPETHTHEDRTIALTPHQRAGWVLCCPRSDREAYLRKQWEVAHRGVDDVTTGSGIGGSADRAVGIGGVVHSGGAEVSG